MLGSQCHQPEPDRQAVGGRGAHGHQQIHIATAMTQGQPPLTVKAPPQHKLYRRRQQPLPQGRQSERNTHQCQQHGQLQRHSEQQSQRHRAPGWPPGKRGGISRRWRYGRSCSRLDLKAKSQFMDPGRNLLGRDRQAEFKLRFGGGQIDRHRGHAGQGGQPLLQTPHTGGAAEAAYGQGT